jgi:hypothetical protein
MLFLFVTFRISRPQKVLLLHNPGPASLGKTVTCRVKLLFIRINLVKERIQRDGYFVNCW